MLILVQQLKNGRVVSVIPITSLSSLPSGYKVNGCSTLNITSRFKAERKRQMRSRVCSSSRSFHKPHQQFQFSAFQPELCFVANQGSLRKKHQRMYLSWITSTDMHRAFPVQAGTMNFHTRNSVSSISPSLLNNKA